MSVSANIAGSIMTHDEEVRFRTLHQHIKHHSEPPEIKNPFKKDSSDSDSENATGNKFLVRQHAPDLLSCTNGRVNFPSERIGKGVVVCQLKITNLLERPVAFKVKSTCTRLFNIRTPRGILPPCVSTLVKISFVGTFVPADLHHFIGVFGVILDETNEKDDPKKIFEDKRDKEDLMRRLFISYSKDTKSTGDAYLTVLRNVKHDQK